MTSAVTTRRRFLAASAAGCTLAGPIASILRAADEDKDRVIQLPIRRREPVAGSEEFKVTNDVVKLHPRQTALLICDVWNHHWCASAERRCDALAKKMAPLVDRARSAGLHVVHAPSDTLAAYKDHPARKRALAVPTSTPPVPIERWCSLETAREGKLPIDDSDGGCDCRPQCKQGSPWTAQHPAIRIADGDLISDDGREIYSYFVAEGVKNVIFIGVHTNMCVLGRSFGIRQMTRLGQNAILVRDLTDTMYNPRMAPFVAHDKGTELVVEHVERHWCPTTTRAALSEGLPG
jgi:nicotinamidase-related amidase